MTLGRGRTSRVGQGVEGHVRKLVLEVGGHGVDEPQERAGRPALFLVDGPAARAGAGIEAVVLGDRGDGGLGIGPQTLPQVADQLATHLLVGQAELGVLGHADALDLAEPIGMGFKVFLGRDERVERVDETLVDLPAAVEVVAPRGDAVGLVAGGPDGIERRVPERLAVFQRRFEADVQPFDGQAGAEWYVRSGPRPPAAADDVFQERVDRVNRAARAPSGQDEIVSRRPDDDFLRGQGRSVKGRVGQAGRAGSHQEPSAAACPIRRHRVIAAGDNMQEEAELGRGGPVRLGGIGRHDNPGFGQAPGGEHDFGRCRRGERHENQDGQEGEMYFQCPHTGILYRIP
jgi:hypothetical protein